MNADLQDLYQEIILEHNRSPRNSGVLDDATGEAHGNNPLCGDRVTVHVRVEEGSVADVRFDARGCAISIASASMMTEVVKGKTVADASDASARFVARLTSKDAIDGDGLGELAALSGVRKFPARVKCATLAWHTFCAALNGSGEEVTTE